MTIKQLGGVFGRNPTFNDVTIEGQLTFDGDIDINSDLKVDGDLDVTGNINTDTYLSVTAGSPNIRFMESDTTDENYRIRGQGGELIFEKITDAASVVAENFRVDGSNNVKINAGNLVIGTSGKGIDFSATAGTGTSELFDDYEEGSFTVEVFDAASGGNQSSTTTTGYYTKIGRQITITFSGLNNISTAGMTASNFLYISLPFTSDGSAGSSCGNLVLDGASFPAGSSFVSPSVSNNASRMLLRASGDGVVDSPMEVQDFNGTTNDIQSLTITYFE